MSSNKQTKAGSLRDRIAQFNNPDSTPLVPQSAFGYGAPTKPDSSQTRGKGLIGNRIPSYNAKNIAAEMIVGAPKKVENRGLYGNRIPALTKSDVALKLPAEASVASEGNQLRTERGRSALQGDVSNASVQEIVDQKTLVPSASPDGDARSTPRDTLIQGACGVELGSDSPVAIQEATVTDMRTTERVAALESDVPIRLRVSDQVQQSPKISQIRTQTGRDPPPDDSISHSAVSINLGSPANAALELEQPCEPALEIHNSAAETIPNRDSNCFDFEGEIGGLTAAALDVGNQNVGNDLLQSQPPIVETLDVERINHPRSDDTKRESTSEAGSGVLAASDRPADNGDGTSHLAAKDPEVTVQTRVDPEPSLAPSAEFIPTHLEATTNLVLEPDNGQPDLSVSDFHAQFVRVKTDLQVLLQAGHMTSTDRRLASEKLAWLRKNVNQANDYLPRYDQSRYQEQIAELDPLLRSQKQQRKLFSFKSIKPAPLVGEAGDLTPTEIVPIEPESTDPDSTTRPSDPVADVHRLEHIRDRYITLAHLTGGSDSPFDELSLTVADVEGCIIDLCEIPLLPAMTSGIPAQSRRCTALYMDRVRNTVIVVGSSILGSVLLQQLEDCVVVVGAHQFRLHESHRCSVLLATQSIPTIEKSTNIRFGGFPEELGLPGEPDSSTEYQVNDFDWLREGPSPHWSWQRPIRWPFTTLGHATDLNVTRVAVLKAYLPRIPEGHKPNLQRPTRLFDDNELTNEETGWAKVQTTRTKYS